MPRIGQLLCESVPLSVHDVEEILQEQRTTRQRFGDMALALGKARSEQVWAAWLTQLHAGAVDVDRLSIDAQTLAALRAAVATTRRALPLCVRGEELIVAVAVTFECVVALERASGRRVIAAAADGAAVDRAIARHYPATVSAA